MKMMKKKKLSIFLLVLFCLANFNFKNQNLNQKNSNNLFERKPNISQSNIQLISESDSYTSWNFINETSTPLMLYREEFINYSQGFWGLETNDGDTTINISSIPLHDSFVDSATPTTNYGNNAETFITPSRWTYSGFGYGGYLFGNYSKDSEFSFYNLPIFTFLPTTVDIYEVFPFDENVITWNKRPIDKSIVNSIVLPIVSTPTPMTVDIGKGSRYFSLRPTNIGSAKLGSSESSLYKPKIEHFVSKYFMGNTMIYCQTDETEILALKSPNNLSLNLRSNDIIEVKIKRKSTNRIDMNLKKNDNIEESFIVQEQDNEDFITETLKFTIDQDISIDQIEFKGLFEDHEYVAIFHIKIYRGKSEKSVYLSPYGDKEVSLPYPINYTLEIYEKGIFRELKNITTRSDLQVIIFEKTFKTECYLTYYDPNLEYLDWNKFTTYANYSLEKISYIKKRLISNTLFVDEDSWIDFEIFDTFNNSVRKFSLYAKSFIDIVLNIFSLKIKNEASEYVNYSIQSNSIIKYGNMFSGEIIEFSILTGNYMFNYTNHEDNSLHFLDIDLINNRILIINTTYHVVYFAPFLSDGTGMTWESVKFYINGSRRDFGFNTVKTKIINITVLDFFNQTIFTKIVNILGLIEYNIYLDVFSLKIKNKASEMIYYSIKLNGMNDSSFLFPDEIKEYLVKGGIFNITYINYENMEIESLIVSVLDDYFLIINTTFFQIYFAIFNFDGLGLSGNIIRFYINNERRDLGFNILKKDWNNIKVLDFFNASLFDSNLYLRDFTEYNILVEVFNLIIHNNYSHSIYIEIERNDITIRQIIPDQADFSYRFLPNVDYRISSFYLNGSLIEERDVRLESNNQIVNFGFYSVEVPIDPVKFTSDLVTIWSFLIFLFVAVIVAVVLYLRLRGDSKRNPRRASRMGSYRGRSGSLV